MSNLYYNDQPPPYSEYAPPNQGHQPWQHDGESSYTGQHAYQSPHSQAQYAQQSSYGQHTQYSSQHQQSYNHQQPPYVQQHQQNNYGVPYAGGPYQGSYQQDPNQHAYGHGQMYHQDAKPQSQAAPRGESASYYNNTFGQQPAQQSRPWPPVGPRGPEGEKGLGASLLGGAGGAFLGHKFGKGILASAGTALAGAIGANVIQHGLKHKHKKHHSKKHRRRRSSSSSSSSSGSSR